MDTKYVTLRTIGVAALLGILPAEPADAQALPRALYENIQLNGNVPLSALSDRVETTDPSALTGHLASFLGQPKSSSCEADAVRTGVWFCEFEWPGIYASYLTAGEPFFYLQWIRIDEGFIELDGNTLHVGDTVDGLADMFPDAWEAREERCDVYGYEPCAWYVGMFIEPEFPSLIVRYEGWWVTKIMVFDPYPV